jgi:hypothetical protein
MSHFKVGEVVYVSPYHILSILGADLTVITAPEYLQIIATLLNKGMAPNGHRVLDTETVNDMCVRPRRRRPNGC